MDANPNGSDSSRGRAVLIDDDEFFVESLALNLREAGYQVLTFGDGPTALSHLFANGPIGDFILLDWRLPGMTGMEVLRKLRDGNCHLPVIFLTVLGAQVYEEVALLGGAVDFVEKSRSFSILLKRIELILGGRKAAPVATTDAPAATTLQRIGKLELALDSNRASWDGTQVNLTLTEFKIVVQLATKAGKDVRYRDIYDLVHGEGFAAGDGAEGYRTNVRTLVRRIRQKFRDVDADFDHIENYPGFGYRWRTDDVPDR